MSSDVLTLAIAAATWVVAGGTVFLMWWQMSQQRELNSASTILALRDRYDTPQMRASRKRLSQHLLHSREPHDADIGVVRFFEMLGFLTHRRVLDRRMVWNAFGGWVTSYYYLLTHPADRIAEWRKEFHDPMVFAEFEWLSREMMRIDLKLSGQQSKETRSEDSQGILRNELVLDAPA
jgi:hypothetical protein